MTSDVSLDGGWTQGGWGKGGRGDGKDPLVNLIGPKKVRFRKYWTSDKRGGGEIEPSGNVGYTLWDPGALNQAQGLVGN